MTNAKKPTAAMVTLEECPIGLFWKEGELCLKTEYGNNEGRIDAYIVSSGEFFWGDQPQTIANQRKNMVTPVDTDFAMRALEPAAPVEDGEDVEWPKAKCGNHLDRFPCQECRARVPAECPRYERDYAQPPAADALVEALESIKALDGPYCDNCHSSEINEAIRIAVAALAKLQGGGE